MKVKAHASSRALLRRLIGESVRPYAKWLIAALACMSLMAGATALTAYLLDPVVNDVFIAQDRDFLWLIGGVVLRVGDTVYDGSVATQLQRTRRQMISRSIHEIQSGRDRFSSPAGD